MHKSLSFFVCLLLLYSCQSTTTEKDTKRTASKENVSSTIDTSIAKLGKLINLTKYKPGRVRYRYTFIDNSGQNDRISVPGPSDSYLEAVLYFDTTTFDTFKRRYFSMDYSSPNYQKQSFDFEWLDAKTKAQLAASDSSYHGHPDCCFELGPNGALWLLENKVLLRKSTN